MALPAAAQAQLDSLRSSSETPPTSAPAPAPAPTPPISREADTKDVVVSREEFNELQAAAGRVRAAEGKTESLQMDVEALQARLTAAEEASKGITKPKEGEGAGHDEEDWQPTPVQFTEQETTDYGDSKEYIEKVVLDVLNKVLPQVFGRIKNLRGAVGEVKGAVESTVRRTEQVEGRDFNDQVRSKLKESGIDFDAITNHQHWQAFAESEDPQTEYPYAQVLMDGVKRRKIGIVVRVMKDFAVKYGLAKRNGTSGYEGAIPGGSSRLPENTDDGEGKLPFSKRKEAHKKFINGEMSQSEYQRICDEYSAAEKTDRIDYDA